MGTVSHMSAPARREAFSSRVSLARTALRSTEDMVRCGMLHGVVYREVKDDP